MGIPYQKHESMRSLLLKPNFEMSIEHEFRQSDFHPVPDVNIVLFRISKKKSDLTSSEYIIYKDFIAYIYNSGNNTNMKNVLGKIFSYNQIKKLSKDLKFDLNEKFSKIEYSKWIGIFHYFQIGVSIEKKQIIRGQFQKLTMQQKTLVKQHRNKIRK
jgi:23S rRNA (adenine-N6)-dimethyltransferase